MKILLIFLLFLSLIANSQIKDTVHLSFDPTEIKNECKKVTDDNGFVHIYIRDQHFKSIKPFPDDEEFNHDLLQNVRLVGISEFLELAHKERKRLIMVGEKNQAIKILFNNEVFEKIYLYQKINDECISRLEVGWIEEIE